MMKSAIAAMILSAALSAPAVADPTPAPASVPGTVTTLTALLDEGYEVRSVQAISGEDQKLLWPSDPVGTYSLMVLQKGTSLASCVLSTGGLASIYSSLLSQNNCHKR